MTDLFEAPLDQSGSILLEPGAPVSGPANRSPTGTPGTGVAMPRMVPAFDELQIRLTPGSEGRYHVAVSSASGGAATARSRCRFRTSNSRKNFRLTVDPRGGRVRGRSSPQVQRAREFGEALFGALLEDDAVRDVYVAAAHDAETARRGLRLTLYVTAAPDLAGVPWKFLYPLSGVPGAVDLDAGRALSRSREPAAGAWPSSRRCGSSGW